ncbi:MFS transporter [Gandjariella thermophila]|uniref:MFS transporter n=2 Tax=Gandjariella thermophila TaxID=1931992 RepID=A0A4D4J6H5_9PSEU|nr:MFS transporter [Gandjariella thermophila]GDY30169.1 MFS transporter [Gandjariella thermophila]
MPAYVGGSGSARKEHISYPTAFPPTEPETRRRTPTRGMFASLRTRNYRYYASGQVVSLIGVWMQRVAQDWLVLNLSHGSPVALGIAAALQFLPTLLLSLWAGVLADRMDKRRLLLVLESGLGLCALALGLLDVTGLVQLWQVYLLCLALGAVSAVETPVRQSFVVEMVGREQLTNAVALNSMTFNLARMVGPAIAGVMITAIGTGWVFLANAASFVGVLAGLAAMRPDELHRGDPVPARKGQLVEGLRYVRGRIDLVIVLAMVFFVSTFGLNFYVSLAVVARNVFHGQADAYGFLSTLLALGTLSGATLAARRSARSKPGPKLLVVAALAFGALETVSGVMPTLWTVGLVLIPTGIAAMTFMTTANSTVQLAVSPAMRGRVMGLYMLVMLGTNPIGGPLMGWLAAHFTGRSPLVVGGVVTVLAGVFGGLVLAARGGVRKGTRTASPPRVLTGPRRGPSHHLARAAHQPVRDQFHHGHDRDRLDQK